MRARAIAVSFLLSVVGGALGWLLGALVLTPPPGAGDLHEGSLDDGLTWQTIEPVGCPEITDPALRVACRALEQEFFQIFALRRYRAGAETRVLRRQESPCPVQEREDAGDGAGPIVTVQGCSAEWRQRALRYIEECRDTYAILLDLFQDDEAVIPERYLERFSQRAKRSRQRL